MKKTKVILLFIILGLLLSLSQIALAEEFFDFRTDTQSYCRTVAELNAALSAGQATYSDRESSPSLVLFSTASAPLDFTDAGFEVYSVAYGPYGFSTLICDAPETAVSWLLAQESVSCAEPDGTVTASSLSFHSWGAEKTGIGDYITFAEEYGDLPATVAVIDSGVYEHTYIAPKLLSYGYDYVDNDDDPTNDLNGHGTHVAGILADCTQGVMVYIHPIRVLDATASGKISNVVSAVLEAIDARVDVINLSLTTFVPSDTLESAIRSAVSAGITVVAAAGNNACNTADITPASMQDAGVIIVGSVDADGSRSSFSNYGDSVDVYAYGRDIISCSMYGGYVADSGTSMATPHVSALCAMLRLTHPNLTPATIEARIVAASTGAMHIPSAGALVPRSLGFSLQTLRMDVNDQLELPAAALPATAQASISYASNNTAVADVTDGMLITAAPGEATIIARCWGLNAQVFTVTVDDMVNTSVILPAQLQTVEAEAFAGLETYRVILEPGIQTLGDNVFQNGQISFIKIPDTLTDFGSNSFAGALLLCPPDSAAHTYALQQGLPYLLTNAE